MRKGSRRFHVAGAIVAASLLIAAGEASALCARPAEMTALKVAALRQRLMVAALACRQADAFNRFVIAYQGDLESSDRDLMGFFSRRDGDDGADSYNAYKTKLANDASLRSLRDPGFCLNAWYALTAINRENPPLAQWAAQQATMAETGVEACARTTVAAAPAYP